MIESINRSYCRFAKDYLLSQARSAKESGVRIYRPSRDERLSFYQTLCNEYPINRKGNHKSSCWRVDITDHTIPAEKYGKDHVTHIVCKGRMHLFNGSTECAMFLIEKPPQNGHKEYGIHFHVGGADETLFLREPREGVHIYSIMSKGAKNLPKILASATRMLNN
ncbi:MAG: hypothetical protein JW716_00470 [Candidatus Aenigmarchaeota archaeon]|nr:hypothetical protein [Candidatus Aenigmarchaeota archaeon]